MEKVALKLLAGGTHLGGTNLDFQMEARGQGLSCHLYITSSHYNVDGGMAMNTVELKNQNTVYRKGCEEEFLPSSRIQIARAERCSFSPLHQSEPFRLRVTL